MSGNTFGKLFAVTSFGESHGPALGCIVDGCPPGLPLTEEDLQRDVERRRSGKSRHTSQRREPDQVRILSGVFEGRTTGAPIGLLVENQDQRSRDYAKIKDVFRPGHADYTYAQKYGFRDYRGGGRSSARETAARVAAGGLAREAIKALVPGLQDRGSARLILASGVAILVAACYANSLGNGVHYDGQHSIVENASVLSLDLPSGLDCDTGQPCGVCVQADVTVTFVAEKYGFRQSGADQ